jgi:2-polyprenyl-3-methyl-5-hydroxy-6-metoxy-1,4-benzoquinol methylase
LLAKLRVLHFCKLKICFCIIANSGGEEMEADRIKWNARYESQESYLGEIPSPFLRQQLEWITTMAPGRNVLDIACGEGRNSLFLAQYGFRVTGLDISDVGIGKGRNRAEQLGVEVDFRRVDLEKYVFDSNYDVVLNFNFLLRDMIPLEVAVLNPGGLLLFDTIMASETLLQSRTTAYLLQPGELTALFANYDGDILFAEESCNDEMPTARLLFRKNTI